MSVAPSIFGFGSLVSKISQGHKKPIDGKSRVKLRGTRSLACLAEALETRTLLSVTPITYGQVKNGSIAFAQTQYYTFTGTAKDQVAVTTQDTRASYSFGVPAYVPVYDLVKPDGKVLASVNGDGDRLNAVLPINGTYVLRVHDDNYTDTGNYQFGLYRLVPQPAAQTIAFGTVTSGSVTAGPDVHFYQFNASANQKIAITTQNTQGSYSFGVPYYVAVYDLIKPDGTVLASVNGDGNRLDETLPVSGTYILSVHDNNYNDTGNYQFGIYLLSTVANALSVPSGTPVSGLITNGPDMHFYRFFGRAQETVALSAADTRGDYSFGVPAYVPIYDILNPNGTLLMTVPAATRTDLTLPSTGNYYISIHDDNYTESGTFTFQLDWTSPLNGGISGNVFNDANGNAKKDTGETPLANWNLFLDANKNGILDAGEQSTTTDSLGNYAFNSVPAGSYVVHELPPAGWAITKPSAGSYPVALNALDSLTGRDFGNKQTTTGQISGFVFHDYNGDGKYSAGERPLAGWKVFIDANANNTLDAGETFVLTGATGAYSFTNLPPEPTALAKFLTAAGCASRQFRPTS